ncbi:MAG: hypothetical protein ACRC6A_09245 [Fusobacteriaceae bacterium]
MAGGRPRKLSDADYKSVEKLAKLGLTKEMIADYVEIAYCNMYLDTRFQEVYKKAYTQLGAKVRTTLISKIDTDTTANIYLDKVLNKTTEKNHDDNIQMKRDVLELEREKVEKGLTTEPINVIIQKASEK